MKQRSANLAREPGMTRTQIHGCGYQNEELDVKILATSESKFRYLTIYTN